MTPSGPGALELALGALLFFGLGDLVYKRGAAAGAQAHHFLMVQAWVFAPTVLLYALLTDTLRLGAGALWGALAGVFALVGFYNFAHSLKSGSISINAPVFRLSFVLTAALAIALLGEPLTPYKAGGIALALGSAWLLLGGAPATGQAASRETRASFIRVLVATVSVGIANFIYSLGLRAGATPGTLITTQAAVVVALSSSFVALTERAIRPSTAALRHAPVAALVLAAAFMLMVESMARGEASVSVPIAQMGFVVTAVLGFLVLGERFTARKGLGIVAAVGALASLAHG